MAIISLIKKISRKRAELFARRIFPLLKNKGKIIDIGCGTCHITEILKNKGKKVTPIDVEDKSLIDHIKPILYDGKHLPFPDGSFEIALLLMVLHHTPNPEAVFLEAARVGAELIIIETVYKNLFDKICIVLFDSLMNRQLQFFWNSYRKDTEWQRFFIAKGYNIVSTQHYCDWFVLPYFHSAYYLKKK